MIMAVVRKYAQVFNPQVNYNGVHRLAWHNLSHAVGGTENNYAYADTSKKNFPWTVTAHKFNLNIPTGAYIRQIKFQVKMKASKSGVVTIPKAGFFTRSERSTYSNVPSTETGYYKGVFWSYGNRSKLTTTPQVYNYTMLEENVRLANHTVDGLNSTACGVDLVFKEALDDARIYIDWVLMEVYYDMPSYRIEFDRKTYKGSPRQLEAYKYFNVDVKFYNESKAIGTSQTLDIKLPFGTQLHNYSLTESEFNPDTMKWSIDAGTKYARISLGLSTLATGLKELKVANSTLGSYSYWYNATSTFPQDYGEVNVTVVGEAHKNHPSCFEYHAKVYSEDTNVEIDITHDRDSSPTAISYEFLVDESTQGVTVNEETSTPTQLKFTVPTGESNIAFRVCYYNHVVGEDRHGTVYVDTNGSEYYYDVLDAYDYVAVIEEDDRANDIWRTHWIASNVDTDTYVFPLMTKPLDAVMIMTKPTLKMYKWEQLDYIGCVPLEHLHFAPKSTYKDSLLNQTYKNKTYMGKKGVLDEDITLNVRLHPPDVTTMQGLIAMDKPIPINANHRCFEGDALNHRGWAEIYSIKAERTNPHWYKCDIDVKYITHNIHTRFEINRAKKSTNYKIPSLLAPTFESGDKLDELFYVNTDGTYTYDEKEEDEPYPIDDKERNVFSLFNAEKLSMRTQEPLGNVANFSLSWISEILPEDKENQITRIVSLIDAKTNEAVFKYEYQDFQTTDIDYLKGYVTAISRQNNEWQDEINHEINLAVHNGSYSDINDEDDADTGIEIITEGESTFGSVLHFNLNNRKLEVIDEGFNGKEIYKDDIELEGSSYYVEVEIKNNNVDVDNIPVTHFLDVELMNTILITSVDADKYSKMYISPFAVADKRLLFTRESEEGTIYYYDEDGKRFTYMIEPYYQYHTGVDLKSRDGISLFTLNNSYDIVYVQNGLIRFGFNRFTGDMYLGKWDIESKQYVTLYNFHINDSTTFTLGAFSDDKIEILASKSKFTMWRGHPYLMINHSDEDIYIKNRFNQVWAEGVGDSILEYPAYYDLLNHENLLDKCVGGIATLDATCVEVTDLEDVMPTADITLTAPATADINQTVSMSISGASSGKVYYLVDGVEVTSANYDVGATHIFKTKGLHTIQVVLVADNLIAFSDIKNISIKNVKPQSAGTSDSGKTINANDTYKLEFLNKVDSVKYMDNHLFEFKLTKGSNPVSGETIEMVLPDGSVGTGVTNSKGIASFRNNNTAFTVGTYSIGGRYYYTPTGRDRQILLQDFKEVKIEKNTCWIYTTLAGRKGGRFTAKIMDWQGNPYKNKRVILYINGAKNVKTTSEYGYIWHDIGAKGHYTYKVQYLGDENTVPTYSVTEETI